LDALRRAGTPIPTHVIWIAATAMQYGLRVLTADRHYLQVSQVIVDYLEA
jgi:predicted nucleic acid-binding protein